MSINGLFASDQLTRFGRLIEKLTGAQVDFIVVGGVAGILVGTGLVTQDLDVVFRVEDENIQRLLGVLHDIDAVYRDPLKRQIRPTAEKLRAYRLNLFETELGRFDALPKLSDRWAYEDLLPRSTEYSFEETTFWSLNVEALIETKAAAGRPKDKMALLYLERLRDLESQPEQLRQMLAILDEEERSDD